MAEGLRDQAKACYEKSLALPGGLPDPALEQELYLRGGAEKPPTAKALAASPAKGGGSRRDGGEGIFRQPDGRGGFRWYRAAGSEL